MSKENKHENTEEITEIVAVEEAITTPGASGAATGQSKPAGKAEGFFKQRWVKIAGFSAAGLLILGIGVGIGEELLEDAFEGGHDHDSSSQYQDDDEAEAEEAASEEDADEATSEEDEDAAKSRSSVEDEEGQQSGETATDKS